MKRIISIILVAFICTFTACDLERLPYTDLPAESIANDPDGSFEPLMNGVYSQMKNWSDAMHRCGEYAGDNITIRGTSTDAFFDFISYSRSPVNYRLNNFWNYSYKVIAQTSNIIKLVDEGKSTYIDNKLGECYFMRGLSYFYLVRAFGRPFYQSPETNLGVPIVNGTPDDVFGDLPDRSNVRETYEQAIRDLEKGAEMMTENNGPIFGSREAAWAILSKVYLFMSGTYDLPNQEYARKSIEYADKVINSGTYSLLDRETFMKYNTFTPENNKETIFAVKRVASEFSGYDHYYNFNGMYAVVGGMGWGEMYASAKYLALLDETGRNDWRNGKIVDARANFIAPQYETKDSLVFRFISDLYNDGGTQTGFLYTQLPVKVTGNTATCADSENTYTLTPIDVEQGSWSIKYKDGKTYQGYVDQFIKLNRAILMFYVLKCSREGEESHLHSPVISRLAEMYLNKAEAAAKIGDYATALAALNTIRERSLPGEGYTSLNASNAEERIDKERTLELAFQAERSYDVYRNGRALTRYYPGAHNAMDVIQPTDYRSIYFIPQQAIDSYPEGSTLTQNPTSN
ncbi:tetratricopeptide (TPR) repeat protein [Parabacteroides sp. PF5-5]|uniref:RagB/SusD family nutrient uptake outer membrane protein n=1 Tax=unclassified Parabacteroides TaxID=2649774 RepID=UPI002473F8C8|nr:MULTISPECIES: RagB/SusD family nutrient uptake outer membrane protein [unclassified Parabacteroides]MDH6303939.1 tetratricopeptide (TPR) repeat protein [Parabacteroides sp. PH5-39]MDH6314556.1 tetratricopeptide (TPR) repeat protein [Parabacteroides sp. PF5-13]MDH6318379.1 tetratricopeptide (TPR) repeat protein [Parabacteroides sp. PH5-13]MDH6322328.1 tetratricopeptide (TPR) repeat protein [Parabacteroides sp. PH5-8]MDH6325592.1 tetratricopeptide (TPR) repeat protein [Parabacteroides sp. PH5